MNQNTKVLSLNMAGFNNESEIREHTAFGAIYAEKQIDGAKVWLRGKRERARERERERLVFSGGEVPDLQPSCLPPHWQQITVAQSGSVAWKCQKCHSESIQIIGSRLHKDHSLEPLREKVMRYTSRVEVSTFTLSAWLQDWINLVSDDWNDLLLWWNFCFVWYVSVVDCTIVYVADRFVPLK